HWMTSSGSPVFCVVVPTTLSLSDQIAISWVYSVRRESRLLRRLCKNAFFSTHTNNFLIGLCSSAIAEALHVGQIQVWLNLLRVEPGRCSRLVRISVLKENFLYAS